MAASLDVVGARIELPFEYRQELRSDSVERMYGAYRNEVIDLVVTSGPAAGEALRVATSVTASDRLEAAAMQRLVRNFAETQISKPGTRLVEPLKIEGYDFYFHDMPTNGAVYAEAMMIEGVVNGAIYRVVIMAKSVKPLTAELALALRSTRLDFQDLLKISPGLKEEQEVAVRSGRVVTPMGEIVLPRGLFAYMSGSQVVYDGQGEVVMRRRSYSLSKSGFWTNQYLHFSTKCGASAELDDDEFIRMARNDDSAKSDNGDKEQSQQKNKTRYVLNGQPVSAQVARLQGSTSTGKWISQEDEITRNGTVRRWVSEQGGTSFQFQLVRFSGQEKIELDIGKQIAQAGNTCRLDLPFSSAGQAPSDPQSDGAAAGKGASD